MKADAKKCKLQHIEGFLQEILKRPDNERAFLLIPVGYPDEEAEVPVISKKAFSEICNVI